MTQLEVDFYNTMILTMRDISANLERMQKDLAEIKTLLRREAENDAAM